LEDALRMMRRDGVRRVPVIGHSGELVGVLSLDDIVEYLAKQLAEVSGSIQAELKNESTLRPASAGGGAP
jgi:CBS domain-containing protein